jgi:hypothetical protein
MLLLYCGVKSRAQCSTADVFFQEAYSLISDEQSICTVKYMRMNVICLHRHYFEMPAKQTFVHKNGKNTCKNNHELALCIYLSNKTIRGFRNLVRLSLKDPAKLRTVQDRDTWLSRATTALTP